MGLKWKPVNLLPLHVHLTQPGGKMPAYLPWQQSPVTNIQTMLSAQSPNTNSRTSKRRRRGHVREIEKGLTSHDAVTEQAAAHKGIPLLQRLLWGCTWPQTEKTQTKPTVSGSQLYSHTTAIGLASMWPYCGQNSFIHWTKCTFIRYEDLDIRDICSPNCIIEN